MVEIIDVANHSTTLTSTTTQLPIAHNITTSIPVSTNSNVLMLEVFTDDELMSYYAIVCCLVILGIVSNTAMILFYRMKDKLNCHFNFCLIHLCVANIIQYLGFIPYGVIDLRYLPWENFSDPVNRLVCAFTDGVTVFFIAAFTSAFILCLMAYVRYQIIRNPLKKFSYTINKTKRYLVLFWLTSVFIFIPNTFSLKWEGGEGPFCLRLYPFGESFFLVFGVVMFMAGFYIPLFFMCVTYILTINRLFLKKDDTSRNRIKHRNHVVAVLGTLIFNFVLCWLPVSAIWLLSIGGAFEPTVHGEVAKTRYYKVVFLFALLAGILNIIFNALVHLKHRHRRSKQQTFENPASSPSAWHEAIPAFIIANFTQNSSKL